jgi:coenzyme F420 hydrogenase subunit delta
MVMRGPETIVAALRGVADGTPDATPAGSAAVEHDTDDILPEFCRHPTLILGCGNILIGDDGFGCELVEYLQEHYVVPEEACLLDVGTGVRKLLFTLCLSPVRPARILVIDAIDVGRPAGEIFEIDVTDIPAIKVDDFSLHQLPTSNLLRELQLHCDVEIRVLACQTGSLPDRVAPGLSGAVRGALPEAAAWVVDRYFRPD